MSEMIFPLILFDNSKTITDVGGTAVSSIEVSKHSQGLPENHLQLDLDPDMISAQITENRQIFAPFQLMSITLKVENGENLFIMTQISPNQTIYLAAPYYNGAFDFASINGLHRHDYYELLYVASGKIYQNIENSRHFYPTGSCCLLNPNVRHIEEYSGNIQIYFLQIRKDYLEDLLGSARYFDEENTSALANLNTFLTSEWSSGYQNKEYMDFIPLPGTVHGKDFIHVQLEQIYQILLNPSAGASFAINGKLFALLCHLFDTASYQHTPFRFASSKEEDLFHQIREYLKLCHGRAGRHQLQEQFHYSGDYLYKLVRKFTGLSLSDYAMSITMEEATRLLSSTKMPISQIITHLGFSNQTHFYRIFRETYGMSPREYRAQ